MKKVCIITRIRNDEFFLKKFINYYGNEFGEENLYVYLDGEDQIIPFDCGKTNIISCKRIIGNIVNTDKQRLKFLSAQASIHLKKYDIVIGVDVDEFIVVDPKLGVSLLEYLSEKEINTSISPLGVDVGQDMNIEIAIQADKPFLEQRANGYLCPRYTKPSIINKPVVWGSGFHRIKGHNFHIDNNLYLFHFGCIDLQMLLDRFKDSDRIGAGWERHIKKRTKTIRYITNIKKIDWDKYIPIFRTIQKILRPIFSLNKPSMYGYKVIVKIPERFRDKV